MSRSVYHEGLFELLFELRDVPLTNNRSEKNKNFFSIQIVLSVYFWQFIAYSPSDNIRSGIRSSTVEDTDVIEEIRANFENATGAHGTSLIRKKVQKKLGLLDEDEDMMSSSVQINAQTFLDANGKAPEFKINIESSSGSQQSFGNVTLSAAAAATAAVYANRDASYPQFLVDSRVLGAQEILQAAQTLQQKRKLENADEMMRERERKEEEVKRAKLAEGSGVSLHSAAVTTGIDSGDIDNDIEWEDDGDEEDDG